jgi:hypothetical protein
MALGVGPVEIIDRYLDKGIITSNETFAICCPDCIQNMNSYNVGIYVLASVETFLVWADKIPCVEQAAVALSDTTEQPLGAVDDSGNRCKCCTHIYASVETESKFYEEYGERDATNTLPPCSNNFSQCVNDIISTFNSEQQDRFLDKGIVEYGSISGSSQLCKINEYLDLVIFSGISNGTKAEMLDRILDKGIVLSCHNDEVFIMAVETWLKVAGGYPSQFEFNRGWIAQAAVPAIPNKD